MEMDNIITTSPTKMEEVEGWLGSIFSTLHIDTLLEKLNLSQETVIETSIYFTGGVVFGFFAKRYLRQLAIALVLLLLIIKGMELANIGTMIVNWDHIKELTGIAPTDSINSVTSMYLAWLQSHIRQSIAVVVGIFVGSKIG